MHAYDKSCPGIWKRPLLHGLREDGWPWDWTTMAVADKNQNNISDNITAKIIAKSSGIWAGEGLFSAIELLPEEFSRGVVIKGVLSDGSVLSESMEIGRIEGPAKTILALERPLLNLAAYASGIATSTRKMVEIINNKYIDNPPRICITRKTLPYYRDIAIQCAMIGGAFSHRLGLSGGVLIKENHVLIAGGVKEAIKKARRISPHCLKVEAEVRSLSELRDALLEKPDAVLLDNFQPSEVHEAIVIIDGQQHRPLIEVSGGINESNIEDYSIKGVDVISVGCLTHSVRSVDLSMLVGYVC
ncbi:MAG: carboxylating nicotinate-nucleotide diphosphorylase [Bdellovibrionota bacterium]